MSNNALRRLDRARQKEARRMARLYPKPGPTVCEQFSRPITRESLEKEMRRRGLLR